MMCGLQLFLKTTLRVNLKTCQCLKENSAALSAQTRLDCPLTAQVQSYSDKLL